VGQERIDDMCGMISVFAKTIADTIGLAQPNAQAEVVAGVVGQ